MTHVNKFTISPKGVVISGRKEGLRRMISVDVGPDRATYLVLLTEIQFGVFLKLSEAFYVEDSGYTGGFVPHSELFEDKTPGYCRTILSRLIYELITQTGGNWEEPLETLQHKKRIRLNLDKACKISFDYQKLQTFPNEKIRNITENIRRWERRLTQETSQPPQERGRSRPLQGGRAI